jgi:ankyrin repeat protein
MHFAARNGCEEVVEFLSSRGAELNGREKGSNLTPLHLAVAYKHRNVSGILVAKGASIDAKNWRGLTPLHFAASNGDQDIAALLLANGANPNAEDSDGKTALQLAKAEGRAAIVKLLRQYGAKE